ncbi:MAG: aldehyde dehydrogenase family protein [Acidimicrobiaceae bacterium]|nr:aldehyde dehydrogenase family protein [Acidimicrobiaceae bacterium]
MWHEERLLIDGELVDAAGGAVFPTINPATEEVLGTAADAAVEDAAGAVASADSERARSVARRIRTGTVSVNGGVYYGPDAPFGGYKQSGIGREMGVAGFEEFLEIKTLAELAP